MFYFLNIWQTLNGWDQSFFQMINSGCANPFFDTIMPYLRNGILWAPLYLFVLVLVIQNFGLKGIWWCVFFLSTVALTDMTGTYAFKHVFMRLRPCSDPLFMDHVRLVIKQCAGGYSFISNHAANHFGMAVFFLVTLRRHLEKWAWLSLAWASIIIFAQVYVGVHYPLDVLGGALVGTAFGISTGTLFNKRFGFVTFTA
jgi:membrane-associated phospholipid phosphatase